jgi:hypothetical protein
MLGAETRDLIQLDAGVFGPRDRRTGDPPVGAGQSGGQIGPGSGLSMMLLGAPGMRDNFAMCWFPQPDKARFFAEDDGVVPPPDHCLSAVRRGCDGYQVTG